MKSEKSSVKEIYAWILLLCGAVVCRLFPLITKEIWEDELWNYHFASRIQSYTQQFLYPIDDRPPLYFIFLHFYTMFGTSEFLLRLPSLIAGILLIIFIGISIRKSDKLIALITVSFLSFSLFLIDNSWQLRDYGILVLIIGLIFGYVIDIISNLKRKTEISWKTIAIVSILFLIGSLINYLSIPFIISVFLALLCVSLLFRSSKTTAFTCVKLFCSIVPSLSFAGWYLLRQADTIKSTTSWIPFPSVISYLSLSSSFLGFIHNFYEYVTIDPDLLQTLLYSNIGLISILLLCWTRILKNKSNHTNTLAIVGLFGFFVYVCNIIGIAICTHILQSSLFLPRTFLPAAIFFIVSIAITLGLSIREIVSDKSKIPFVLSICLIIFGIIFLDQYTRLYSIATFMPTEQQTSHAMIHEVTKLYNPTDQVIMIPVHYNDLYFPYYWRHTNYKGYDTLAKKIDRDVSGIPQELSQIAQHNRLIIIVQNFIFMPDQRHYTTSTVIYNQKYFERTTSLCKTELKKVFSNEDWTIVVCTTN